MSHEPTNGRTAAGTPGAIPGAAYLRLSLRTYLLAVAPWGEDAHRALRHLNVAGDLDSELDEYQNVAANSGLLDEDGVLSGPGWRVLPMLPTPRPLRPTAASTAPALRVIDIDFSRFGHAAHITTRLLPEERAGLAEGDQILVAGDTVDPILATVAKLHDDGQTVELTLGEPC